MKAVLFSVLLLCGWQSLACTKVIGTYYCGEMVGDIPEDVIRVDWTGKDLEIEMGFFRGFGWDVLHSSMVPGTPSTVKQTDNQSQLTRCSDNSLSILTRKYNKDGRVNATFATHLVKQNQQAYVKFTSSRYVAHGTRLVREETEKSCRRVYLPEDVWNRMKVSKDIISTIVDIIF